MSINNNIIIFRRKLNLEKLRSKSSEYFGFSAFLLGPRMTGKTFMLKNIVAQVYYDLLDVEEELRFKTHPQLFWQEMNFPVSNGVQTRLPDVPLFIVSADDSKPRILGGIKILPWKTALKKFSDEF